MRDCAEGADPDASISGGGSMSPRAALTAAAVSVVITSAVLLSPGGGAQGSQTLARSSPTITAAAPCSGHAAVEVRLAHVDGATNPDRVAVHVRQARPNSRWHLHVAQYQFDLGSVTVFPVQHADAHGQWVARDDAFKGYLKIEVLATSRGGQVCRLGITGRVSPLP
jgi:hypothetical protein